MSESLLCKTNRLLWNFIEKLMEIKGSPVLGDYLLLPRSSLLASTSNGKGIYRRSRVFFCD